MSRRARRLGVAVGVAGLWACLWLPLPAAAHAMLTATAPADAEVVSTPLEQVVLTFSEQMRAPARMTVTGPDGAAVFDGETDVQGVRVVARLAPVTAEGSYAVSWSAVSADDHPLQGTFAFALAGASPAAPMTPAPTDTPALDLDQTPTPAPTAAAMAAPMSALGPTSGPTSGPALGPAPGPSSSTVPALVGLAAVVGLVSGGSTAAAQRRRSNRRDG